jgi:hypothetical protein
VLLYHNNVQTDKNTGSTKCAIDELVNVCVLFVHVHSNLNGLQSDRTEVSNL